MHKYQGGILDAAAVTVAMAGQEAVLVCFGLVALKDSTILTTGSSNILLRQ